MVVSVFAPTNIALIKYWGKRDSQLNLPFTGSFSMTLSDLGTETQIQNAQADHFFLNDIEFFSDSSEFKRVFQVVDHFRKRFDLSEKLEIVSTNNFPTAAGLASSASGMAALVFGLNEFFGLNLSKKEMSIIARQGSGSASRSFWGGFVRWNKGTEKDGGDSFAEQLFDERHFRELRMIVNVVSSEKKAVSSREAMQGTVQTSELYQKWVEENDVMVEKAVEFVEKKDFLSLGKIVEENALFMHETMRNAKPPVDFLKKESWEIIDLVQKMRISGEAQGFVTMDAGPQVKILCLENDVKIFQERLSEFDFIEEQFICSVGSGPRVLN